MVHIEHDRFYSGSRSSLLTHAGLSAAMSVQQATRVPRSCDNAASGRPAGPSSSHSGSSYFDRYPERKLQGPYLPKPALVSTLPSPSRSPGRQSGSRRASPPTKDSVQFPTPPLDEGAFVASGSLDASASRASSARALGGPASIGPRSSPGPRARLDASPQPSPSAIQRKTSYGFLRPLPPQASQTSSNASAAPLASVAKASGEVASTYAASSAALGKSRPRPKKLTVEPVRSIDDIIRSHEGMLRCTFEGTVNSAPKRRMASEGPAGTSRDAESYFPSYDRHPTGPTSQPSRNGVEIFVQSNTSESSLDSVEQEIWDGMRKFGPPSVKVDMPRKDEALAGPRVRSYSDAPRAPEIAATDHPLPQSRAFQAMAHLHSSPQDEAHGALPQHEFGLQEPFVESKVRTRARKQSSRPLTDLFKPADGGELTHTMTIRKSVGRPYDVSYADVGSRTGRAVFVFLGLGAVRYLVGLYDEVAVALGLRLICIDRWGLGRSAHVPMERRSVLGWGSVVAEVADRLAIDKFSILAHSAGAPYAMATALVFGDRVAGPVHLLSPFTGASAESGYRWLRYVPDGVIRTAQVADWKLQGWKLAKAAAGQDTPKSARASDTSAAGTPASFVSARTDWPNYTPARAHSVRDADAEAPSYAERTELPTSGSDSTVKSQSALTPQASPSGLPLGRDQRDSGRIVSANGSSITRGPTLSKKSSLSFLGGLLGDRQTQSEASSPTSDTLSVGEHSQQSQREKLARHRRSLSRSVSISSTAPSWTSHDRLSVSEQYEWLERSPSDSEQVTRKPLPDLPHSKSTGTLALSKRQSRALSTSGDSASLCSTPGSIKEPLAGLGVALLRASHGESQRGSASDLSLVLGKKPWGFDFTDVKSPCRIWHGAKDERVSLASAKWMERSLHDCRLTVVEGAGHNLMTNTAVIFEVLESIQSFAARPFPSQR